MTAIGALSSFRELGEFSPHKRACIDWAGPLFDGRLLVNCATSTQVLLHPGQTAPLPGRFKDGVNLRPEMPWWSVGDEYLFSVNFQAGK